MTKILESVVIYHVLHADIYKMILKETILNFLFYFCLLKINSVSFLSNWYLKKIEKQISYIWLIMFFTVAGLAGYLKNNLEKILTSF